MPAVARGAKQQPNSRSRRDDARGRSRDRQPARPYTPAKLDAAQGLGIGPAAALTAAAVVVFGGLGVALAGGDRAFAPGLDQAGVMLGFGVEAVHVQGASPHAEAAIRKAAGVEKGDSLLGIDLGGVRRRVEADWWVKEATVVRLLPNTVVIAVKERTPLAVWQHQGRVGVVDAEGSVIRGADAGAFSRLPLVVGAGAAQAAPEILPLVSARPRLASRLEALVRVDQRRWDLRLKDGAIIQLPALDEDAALIQLDQLDRRANVLELGFAKIDLRDPDMIAVRPREPRSVGPAAEAAPVQL